MILPFVSGQLAAVTHAPTLLAWTSLRQSAVVPTSCRETEEADAPGERYVAEHPLPAAGPVWRTASEEKEVSEELWRRLAAGEAKPLTATRCQQYF